MDRLRHRSSLQKTILAIEENTPIDRSEKALNRSSKFLRQVSLSDSSEMLVSSEFKEYIDSGLISKEAWQSLSPPDQQALADLEGEPLIKGLQKHELLTPYQAVRLRVGQRDGLVIGNYRILERIGAGGMGVVFKAEQIKLRRSVALKLLAAACHGDRELLHRFWTEAQLVAKLNHPNIVTAIDAGEVKSADPLGMPIPYFVMEFLDGQDLEERVVQGSAMAVPQACKIACSVAEALAEAHQHELIHRDIKPSNIFLTSKGVVKVLDFGLARDVHREGFTAPGMLLGTIGYMAPEQAIDPRKADQRSDLFSLGCTLFWALTGKCPLGTGVPPFGSGVPKVRMVRREIPIELEEIIARLMAVVPADRFPDALSVYRALLPFTQEGIPNVSIINPSNPPSKVKEVKKRRILVIDDSPTIRFLAVQSLQRVGYECTEVTNGKGGIEFVEEQDFDLILLDHQLSDMPGEEVLKRIREMQRDRHLKILLMSRSQDLASLAHLRVAWADDCISKPFTGLQLLNIVQANLKIKEEQEAKERQTQSLASQVTQLRVEKDKQLREIACTRDFFVEILSRSASKQLALPIHRGKRLSRYAQRLAEALSTHSHFKRELTPEKISHLVTWIPLMDIGFFLLPEEIRLSSEKRTGHQQQLWKTHPILGCNLIQQIAYKEREAPLGLDVGLVIIRSHHERFDGTGFPDGLMGHQIPFVSQIAGLLDHYERQRIQVSTKPGRTHESIVEDTMCSIGPFNRDLLRVFEKCAPDLDRIYRELPD